MANDDDLSAPLDLPGGEQVPPSPKKRPKVSGKKFKKILVGLVIVLVLGGLTYAALKFVRRHSSPKAAQSTSAAKAAPPAEASSIPSEAATKSYTSGSLGLTLAYPANWTVTPVADGGIRIESPDFSYQTVDKGLVNGNFRVYIRQTARAVDDKYIGRGVAIAPSQLISYAKPTATQRTTTYLTNFGLDTPDNFGYFMIEGNFNLSKGDTLGPNYGQEAGTFIITGGYSSSSLTDDLATNMIPVSAYAQNTAYKEAVAIVTSLQLQ